MTDRKIVFVTHANPEDNPFGRWLTLKLTALGYRAWSDGTELFGGEDFWRDIETVIRQHTAKLVFVLSRASNRKTGCIRELRIANATANAEHLSDFVIPVRLDDLLHGDMNIELNGLDAIDCGDGWAAALKQLVAKLERHGVPRCAESSQEAVRRWWDKEFSPNDSVQDGQETHYSNWFSLTLPEHLYIYSLIGLVEREPTWGFPFVWRNYRLVTFAPPCDVEPGLGTLSVQSAQPIPTTQFLSSEPFDDRNERRNIITELVSTACGRWVGCRGLKPYLLSGGRKAFYFDNESLPDPDVHFTTVSGGRSFRSLIGYKTQTSGRRYWHFAVSFKPAVHPQPMLMVRTHVLFSNDKLNIWESADAMHRARRSQCKQWWNDDWRDRLLATLSWLAGDQPTVPVPFSPSANGVLSARPIEFLSPVCLAEPSKQGTDVGDMGDMGHVGDVDEEDDEDDADLIDAETAEGGE